MGEFIELGIAVIFFVLAYFIGTFIESKHFKEIVMREKKFLYLPTVTGKSFLDDRPIKEAQLVCGSVVISGDFFKAITASLLSIFGLRIAVAESLVDRARREAILRLKEKVPDSDIILNLRIETMKIGERGKLTGIEAMAYGTAIYYLK